MYICALRQEKRKGKEKKGKQSQREETQTNFYILVFLSAFCAMTGFIAINMPQVLQIVNHISILMYACECILLNMLRLLKYKPTLQTQFSDMLGTNYWTGKI